MSDDEINTLNNQKKSLTPLVISAVGIVFGDIGTSPLYTLKTILSFIETPYSTDAILGVLSLIFWTMIIITSLKYAICVMNADNNNEGGILALMSLLLENKYTKSSIILIGLFGATLIYGDGTITPAISVLSALEGLNLILPDFNQGILPLAVVILLVLFISQRIGTQKIAKLFAPIMLVWFITIGLLGLWGIIHHPEVLKAINPWYGINFIISHWYIGLMILSGVFLCVTGAEALYADMGHFGRQSIRIAWFSIVFPCLLLNYAGQSALVMSGADIQQNVFFLLCPKVLLLPLIILATLATIIASQAIISGTFSMTRQAIQLGWLPRLQIKQTAKESYGQIYIGSVNFLLMLVTILLALFFKTSANLAGAYGMAVSLTMTITSLLLFIVMRRIWQWPRIVCFIIAGFFMIIDIIFLLANSTKFFSGGFIPLLFAIIIFMIMYIWHKGLHILRNKTQEKIVPPTEFMAQIDLEHIPRVPGTAIFLTTSLVGVPQVMKLHLKRNGSLHQHVLLLNIAIENIPYIAPGQRENITQLGDNLWRCSAHYGFMQRPNIPKLLSMEPFNTLISDRDNMTYYIGHDKLMLKEKNNSFPNWQRNIFNCLMKNSSHVTDYYYLPSEQVVEINRIISM